MEPNKLTEFEITTHNLKCAMMIGDDMNKKNSVFLFAVSMNQQNELNVVSGVPDNICIDILTQLLNGLQNGMKINTF
jgi:hypothetical protein